MKKGITPEESAALAKWYLSYGEDDSSTINTYLLYLTTIKDALVKSLCLQGQNIEKEQKEALECVLSIESDLKQIIPEENGK